MSRDHGLKVSKGKYGDRLETDLSTASIKSNPNPKDPRPYDLDFRVGPIFFKKAGRSPVLWINVNHPKGIADYHISENNWKALKRYIDKQFRKKNKTTKK